MKTRVFAGLGNPGAEYEGTYHNVGKLALEAILRARTGEGDGMPDLRKHKDLFEYAVLGGDAYVLPLVYMNESGLAIREAMKKFGASPRDLVVFHDESDLTVGSYKISTGRNSAGHKGVQSIMDVLGNNEFTRVRIGIRPEKERVRKKASEFVLKNISARDQKKFEVIFKDIAAELAK